MNTHDAVFIKSAAASRDFITDGLPQIIFSGKSNVGKSSIINKLLNRKNFARVSGTPGKTIHVNYFYIGKSLYFVDLPGYGYAKVSKAERARWSKLMEVFFSDCSHITLGIMIVDSRHRPTADDVTMSHFYKASTCPFIVVANKIDKLKKSEIEPNISLIRETLELNDNVRIIPFSAEKGTGKDSLLQEIENACIPQERN